MKKNILFLTILALLLLSCFARLESVMEGYEKAPLCCRGLEDFDYEKINLGESKKFWIKTDAKAFVFEGGKSFFKAFELPDFQNSYKVIIKSYFVGDRPQKFYIFSPMVIFLDKDFEVTQKILGDVKLPFLVPS